MFSRNPHTTLPLFAYGFLQPGEIAYPQIAEFVESVSPARIGGRLWHRDGLLFLERTDDSVVEGSLLRFRSDQTEAAYLKIDELEPYDLYRWDTSEVSVGETAVEASVLLGRSPQSGSEPWKANDWRTADDPLFNEALQEIESIAAETRPDDPTEPRAFFRKHMAYLLLWTSIERYVSLRWGFGEGPTKRVRRLAEEPAFCEALVRFVDRRERIRRTDDPTKSVVLDKTKPVKSVDYYYQVRSNMTHRGKAAFRDRQIVEDSLRELLLIYKHVLGATLGRSATDHVNLP